MNRILVLVNPSAGTIARAADPQAELDRVRAAFAKVTPRPEIVIAPPQELIERAKTAARERAYDAVIAGGGDGTLNAIAAGLLDSTIAFGVLALGTHNHFAKELNVPLDVDQAVPALVRGTMEDLPVGEVNGRIFLNFTSLGLHVEIVEERDAQQETKGRSKWLAMVNATVRKISDPPLLWVKIVAGEGGRAITRVTPSVIVCNNPYQMKVFGVEDASVTDRSILNVYIAKETRPMGLVRLLVRAAVGRLDEASNFEVLPMREFALFTRRGVRLSIDGELIDDVRPPFRFRVRMTGLKVLRPQPS